MILEMPSWIFHESVAIRATNEGELPIEEKMMEIQAFVLLNLVRIAKKNETSSFFQLNIPGEFKEKNWFQWKMENGKLKFEEKDTQFLRCGQFRIDCLTSDNVSISNGIEFK